MGMPEPSRDGDVPLPPALADVDEPSWAAELDEAVFAGGSWPDTDETRSWRITTERWAEWAMRKLGVLRRRGEQVAEQAAAWRKRIDEWEAQEQTRINPAIEFFSTNLEMYALDVREQDPKRATIRLPSGTIATRQPQRPTIHIADETKLLKWLADNVPSDVYEQVVRTTEKVLVSELRKRLAWKEVAPDGETGERRFVAIDPSTGEFVPGTHTSLDATTADAKPDSF